MGNIHEAQYCAIRDCVHEAEHWIDTKGIKLSGEKNGVVYLCKYHAYQMQTEDGTICLIDGGMNIVECEVCGYSCADDCKECNPLLED